MIPPRILIRRLRFGYPGQSELFHGLDLDVQPGEALGIIGPNGCGKSTLLRLLVGLHDSGGSIHFDDTPLTPPNLAALRRRVGLVFQDSETQLFMPTVLEDVAFGLLNQGLAPAQAEARARDMLRQIGLESLADRPPHQLSGGEQRRAALAGVLVMQPDVLLLDEPSLNLDPRGRRQLIELLDDLPRRLNRPVTRVITSHDLDLVWDLCDRAALLDGGQIVASAPPDQLLRDADLLAAHGLEPPLSLLARPRILPASPPDQEDRQCI